MFKTVRPWAMMTSAVMGLCLMAGCQATGQQGMTDHQTASAQIPDLGPLVVKATAHHRRPFRKPVRDQRDKAMQLLVRKTDALLAEVSQWDSNARLTGIGEAKQGAARTSISDLRASLETLKRSAQRKSVSGVRGSYARATENYRQVVNLTGPIN